MKMFMILLIVLALAVTAFAAGCGGDKAEGPKEAFTDFMDACASNDMEAARELLSEKSRAELEDNTQFASIFEQMGAGADEPEGKEGISIYKVEERGENTTLVYWKILDKEGKEEGDSNCLMVKENDKWKVGLYETIGEDVQDLP